MDEFTLRKIQELNNKLDKVVERVAQLTEENIITKNWNTLLMPTAEEISRRNKETLAKEYAGKRHIWSKNQDPITAPNVEEIDRKVPLEGEAAVEMLFEAALTAAQTMQRGKYHRGCEYCNIGDYSDGQSGYFLVTWGDKHQVRKEFKIPYWGNSKVNRRVFL